MLGYLDHRFGSAATAADLAPALRASVYHGPLLQVNAKDGYGSTALHWAGITNNVEGQAGALV